MDKKEHPHPHTDRVQLSLAWRRDSKGAARGACASLALVISGFAYGQSPPEAGNLLREAQRTLPSLTDQPAPGAAILPAPAASPKDNGPRFTVRAFKHAGNTLVPDADIQAVLAPWLARPIGFLDLEQAALAVSELYARRGWFVRPQWPEQDVQDGVVQLKLIEARVGAVRIDGDGDTLRLRQDYLTRLLTTRQAPGEPLQREALERATQLLNDTPGVSASVSLSAGRHAGESDLVVKARNKPLWTGFVQADQQGTRSTGTDRMSAGANLDNPTGRGDQGSLNSSLSEGTTYLKLSYSLPVGFDGLRIGVQGSLMHYRLIGDFAALDAKGRASTLGFYGSYPVVRSALRNLNLGWVLEQKSYHNRANGTDTSRKTAHTLQIHLQGDSADNWMEGGFTLWGVQATLGQLDLSGNSANQAADRQGPATEGSFSKLGLNLARLQRLSASTSLWASASGQVARKNLDSSEKFSLGGPFGVRAYPALEAQGDSGWLGNLELRHNLRPELQASAFYDHGQIQVNHNANYPGATALNRYALKGYGLGLQWNRPGDYVVRASLARRSGSNPAANTSNGRDSDGSRDLNRLWLSGIKYF